MSHLLATPRGITLAGVILAKRNSDGSFAIKGNEKSIHAQLQAAYGRAVHPQAMRYVERGCELLAKVSDQELQQAAYPFHPNPDAKTTSGNDFSDLTKGLMMLALTGLNDMENVPEAKERLLKMQDSIHHDSLLKSYGLPTWEQLTKDDGGDEEDDDEDDDSDDSDTSAGDGNNHYNPDEPRIPAGQPGGGQWTTGGNGVSSDSGSISADGIRTALREDFDNYDPSALPLGTQVADSGQIMTDTSINNGDILGYPDGKPIINPNTGTPYPSPPTMNIPDNIEQGKSAGFWDMITWFQHNGPMDYQRLMGAFDGDYTDVTNYNYGVVSAAARYSLDDALSNAGRYNRYFGNTNNTDVLYGLRQTSIANITQGWQDYHLIWSKK